MILWVLNLLELPMDFQNHLGKKKNVLSNSKVSNLGILSIEFVLVVLLGYRQANL